MPLKDVDQDGGVGPVAGVIPGQLRVLVRSAGISDRRDNAAGRTKDLSARALRDSISGRNVSAAGRTKRNICHNLIH